MSKKSKPSTHSISKKALSKKRLLLVFLILCITLILLLGIVWGIELLSQEPALPPYETPHFKFNPVDYEEDIFDDQEYLELINNGVVLTYEESGLSQALIEGKTDQFGEEVAFFAKYISYMIHGEVHSYNKCYSQKYYETNQPKEKFTMQKIHDVKLTYYEENTTDENGVKSVTYKLEYGILENNGTLRDDFLHGTKPQYITISNREGSWRIDSVAIERLYETPTEKVVLTPAFWIILILCFSIICALVIIFVISKKRKNTVR